jgi:RNA polymerase sigma factor (sigma-70 family)
MPTYDAFERCLAAAVQLNQANAWALAPDELHRYASALAARWPEAGSAPDASILRALAAYHADHLLVEALQEPGHHAHADAWTAWSRRSLELMTFRAIGYPGADHADAEAADVAQEALLDLWRGLPTFRYQSRFATWATTILAHALSRYRRARSAEKRAAAAQARSLEAMQAFGAAIASDGPSLDEIAAGREIQHLARQILGRHDDPRLGLAFERAVLGGQSLREIAAALDVSPARVHGLVRQATELIRRYLSEETSRETGS